MELAKVSSYVRALEPDHLTDAFTQGVIRAARLDHADGSRKPAFLQPSFAMPAWAASAITAAVLIVAVTLAAVFIDKPQPSPTVIGSKEQTGNPATTRYASLDADAALAEIQRRIEAGEIDQDTLNSALVSSVGYGVTAGISFTSFADTDLYEELDDAWVESEDLDDVFDTLTTDEQSTLRGYLSDYAEII